MYRLSLFHHRPSPVTESIPSDLLPLFLYYKRDRVGHEHLHCTKRSAVHVSPAAVQGRLIQQFGAERARTLIALFEKSAIPARPTEWRRRMH